MKTKIVSILLTLCLLLGITAALASCGQPDPAPTVSSAAYVTLDINPSIELTTDEDGKVVSVYAANEDASVLLYEEESLIGQSLEDAIDTIVALAIEYGYLDENNKVVGTAVICEDETATADLSSLINTTIINGADKVGLSVTTTSEGAYSLLRELEAFKDAHPDDDLIQALSAADFSLALSASQTDEVTLEVAVTMERDELIELVTTSHKKVEAFVTDAYRMAKKEAAAIYDQAVGAAIDGVYTTYLLSHIMEHTSTVVYGPVYQMYRASARTLNAVADAYSFATKIVAQPLTAEQIDAVCAALSLEDVWVLQDADGQVTLTSVKAYANKLFKNSEKGQALEAIKAELSAALTDIEADVRVSIEEAYAPKIRAAVEELERIFSSDLTGSIPMLDTTLLTDLEDTIEQMKAQLEDGTITADELRTWADLLNTKVDDVLTLIRADLSEEELTEVDTMIENARASANAAKEAFEGKLADAEQEARDRVEQRKSERKGKYGGK